MIDPKLHEKIKKLSKQVSAEAFEKMAELIEAHLEKDPNNADLWLRLGMVLKDYDECIAHFDKALSLDSTNPWPLLMRSYFLERLYGGMDEKRLHELLSFQTEDAEVQSLIYSIAGQHFWFRDEDRYLDYLEKAMEAYPRHVSHYLSAADVYAKRSEFGKELEARRNALKQVVHVYQTVEDIPHDESSVELFLQNGLKGTSMYKDEYEQLQQRIKWLEKQ